MSKNRFEFRHKNLNGIEILTVFSLSTTQNQKIAKSDRVKIGQSYHYSKGHFFMGLSGASITNFPLYDTDSCFDCKYSKNQNYIGGKCYTHKFPQMRGFVMQLRSIAKKYQIWENIPYLPELLPDNILNKFAGKFFRFGTYGEPSNLPLPIVEQIFNVTKTENGKNFNTSYTHQWQRIDNQYSKYFRASVDNVFEHKIAKDMGYLSYIATKDVSEFPEAIICPASIRDTSCDVCKACSGTMGNVKKDFVIKYH
jgi:hypothetical protein